MKMSILYLQLLLVFPLMALSGTASNQVKDYTNQGHHKKSGQLQEPQRSLVITNTDPMAGTGGNFCKELNYILKAIEAKDFGKVIDYNKIIEGSEYEVKVSLSGFTDLSGSDMWGYMSFSGTLENSEKTASDKVYQELVSQIESCIGSSFSKKTKGRNTQFINKKNETFWIEVEFTENVDGKYIIMSVELTYD